MTPSSFFRARLFANTCPMCSESLPEQTIGRKRLYCSLACKMRAYRRRLRTGEPAHQPRPYRTSLFGCLWCGEPLPSGSTIARRYCSGACRMAASRDRQRQHPQAPNTNKENTP